MPTISAIIGYIASGLVLTAFWTDNPRRLRALAILSNVAFISYGALVWLPPVLGLHLLLLPINAMRLARMGKTWSHADHHGLSPFKRRHPLINAGDYPSRFKNNRCDVR